MTRTKEHVDVAIVGAGVIGTSIAAHLAIAAPQLRIALIERDLVGTGTTSKSSANIRGNYSHPALATMARRALEVFHDFENRYGASAGFVETGYVAPFAGRDEATATANVAMQQELGLRTYLVTPDVVSRTIPGISVDDIAGAICEDGAGYAEPSFVVGAFLSICRRAGVLVRQHMPVEVRSGDDRAGYELVGDDTTIHADRVVVAANVWTNEVLRNLGITVPVKATRHQIAMLHHERDLKSRPSKIIVDMVDQFYLRPERADRSLIAWTEDVDELVDPDSYKQSVDDSYLEVCAAYLARRFPGWESVGLGGGYCGVYDVTPDWQPMLGPVGEGSGLMVACGFSGHGFKLSPVIGQGFAEYLARGTTDIFDIDLFSPSRFAAHRPISPAHTYSSGIPLR